MNQIASKLLEKLPEHSAYVVFRPENRRYLTGITSSNGMVLICAEKQVFYTDFRYITMAQRDIRPGYAVELLTESFAKTLARDLPGTVKYLYFEDDYLTFREYNDLSDALSPRLDLIGDVSVLSSLRSVKAPEELAKIRSAQRIAEKAFLHVCDFLANHWKSGTLTELRVAAELDYAMKCEGASNPSFDTIVASGENSAKPHAVPSSRILRNGDFVTMDFGAVYDGYCSDMTRTVALGTVSERMKCVYETVFEAQKKALMHLRAGMTGAEIDALARDVISNAGYGECFGHSLGHGLGLMIHESPNFSPKYADAIPAGCVMSVEPGIYLADEFGVRIEDIVVVTADGCENLTQSPKELLILQ